MSKYPKMPPRGARRRARRMMRRAMFGGAMMSGGMLLMNTVQDTAPTPEKSISKSLKFCTMCGERFEVESKFCMMCGETSS